MMRWLLPLLLLSISSNVIAEDRWAFTPAEKARCTTIHLQADTYSLEMTAPKTAFFQRGTINVGGKPFLVVVAKPSRDYVDSGKAVALRKERQIVVDEPNLLITTIGGTNQYTLRYLHTDGGLCAIFQDDLSLDECMFRAKCAKSLRTVSEGPTPIGQIGQAGIPAADYPKAPRVWHDKSGQHRILARLLAVEGINATLQQARGNPIVIPITKLDDGSAQIVRDAEYHLSIQNQLASLITETQPTPATDPTAAGFRSALSRANSGLMSGQMRLRYRVIAVSGLLPPAERSQFGRYRLHLRPLYNLSLPKLVADDQLTASYRSEWYLNTWEFSPDQVTPGKTILEFTGRAAFDDSQHTTAHMTLKFPDNESILATFGLKGGVPRVYTPGQGSAIDSIAMEFTQPTKLSGDAPPEELATVDVRNGGAQREEHPAMDRPNVPPNDLADNPRRGFDFPKIEIPKVPRIGSPRINGRGVDARDIRRAALERKIVNGNGKKETLQCEGDDVIVNGSNNEVVIRGNCNHLLVNGTGHRVTVEEVAEISMGGRENVVQYERGVGGMAPKVLNRNEKNTVEKVD